MKKIDDEEFLRELAKNLVEPFSERVFELVAAFHEKLAKEKIGPRSSRIGVFGPYPKGGTLVIEWVAKKIADLGMASITGMGYYLANNSTVLNDIDEISPPVIKNIFQTPATEKIQYYYLFPRMVSKALFYMNDERGQIHELRGCYKHSIPFAGFIVHNEISKGELDCGYLMKKDGFIECCVPDISLCSLNMPKKPFCPFHDSINISEMTLELFLKKIGQHRKNRLIAVRNLNGLTDMLESCVQEHKQDSELD